MKKDARFVEAYSQGAMDVVRILVDQETGVQYVQTMYGNVGGLTVLLGRDGKPLIASPSLYTEK